MASVTPIFAVQNTAQTTTSATYVDASCETAALADGVDYLVMFRGQCGSESFSTVCCMQLLHGTTQIAESAKEGISGTILPSSQMAVSASQWLRVTGNGTDTLKIEHRRVGSSTLTSKAMQIVAIPMDEAGVEDTDYFQEASGSTVTDAATGSWTSLQSSTFVLDGSAQSYLVFMSCEGMPTSETDGCRVRFLVDGGVVGPELEREGEDVTDVDNFAVATLVTGLSGSVDFDIEVRSRTSAVADFSRPNTWVIRADHWDQIVSTTDTSGLQTTSTTLVDFTGLDTTYTPNQEEYAIIVATATGAADSSSDALCSMELRNDTDTVVFNEDCGVRQTLVGYTSTSDAINTVMLGAEQISSATTYQVQAKSFDVSETVAVGRTPDNTGGVHSELIVWGLTTDEAPAAAVGIDAVMLASML